MSEGTAAFGLRLAQPADDGAIASIIRSVMPSFGACGPGFAINDPEVDAMSSAYRRPRAAYFVVEQAGPVQHPGVCARGRQVVGRQPPVEVHADAEPLERLRRS